MTGFPLTWYEQQLQDTLPQVWGLTGGIGSGKSFVAQEFANLGIPVLDTDKIAIISRRRQQDQIRACFGTTQPAELRKIVFSDPRKKKLLEDIVIPDVQICLLKLLGKLNTKIALVECALFADGVLLEPIQPGNVITVVADTEVRVKRVMARNDFTREQVLAIIQTQPSDEQRAKISSIFIKNNGDDNIKSQVWSALDLIQRASFPPQTTKIT